VLKDAWPITRTVDTLTGITAHRVPRYPKGDFKIMKPLTLMASVCLFSCASVHAQTSVNVYGIADVGIETLTKAGGSASSPHSLTRMSSGNLSGSRLGFRGNEDLGGGNSALFVLEQGFDLDTGVLGQGGRAFGRQAFVGMKGGYGQVTLGRQQNTLYDMIIKYDPMILGTRYSALTHDPILAGRADNVIKYTGNFGPLTASVFYSFGRDSIATLSNNTFAGEVAGAPKVARNIGGGLNYESGPLGIALVYDQYQGNTIASQDASARRLALGSSYTTGPFKAFLAYRHLKDNVNATQVTTRSDLYWAGLTYQANPSLALTAAMYRTNVKDSSADPSSYIFQALYGMSKRTELYANLGLARNKDGSNLGINGFGSTIVAGENQTGLVLGVRHRF
jgi:predicted porin